MPVLCATSAMTNTKVDLEITVEKIKNQDKNCRCMLDFYFIPLINGRHIPRGIVRCETYEIAYIMGLSAKYMGFDNAYIVTRMICRILGIRSKVMII